MLVVVLSNCELREFDWDKRTDFNVSSCIHEYVVTLDVSVDDAS